MQKLGDIESLTGQGFRSRSIAHSSKGSHRDESRRLSRLTPPHHASHEVRDVDCRRPEHATGGPVLPLAVPEYKPHEQERNRTSRNPSGSHSPSSRIGAVQPSRLHGRGVPSRLRLVDAHQVEQQPLQRIGRFCADRYASASQPARSAPTLPTACANSARVAVLLPRSRAPPWGRPRRVVQTPTGALPFATGRLPHAATGSHWKPLVTYSLRSGPAV